MSQLLANISKPKRNKVELRVDQKFQIIEYQQKHPSLKQTELIKYFNKLFSVNIPAKTMSGILSVANRSKILKQDNVESLNKRIRECKYPDLERMLWLWQTMATNKGISVSDSLLIEKAKEFGQMLGICEGSSFMYSEGWLEKFKKRFNLKLYKIVGESGSVSEELIAKSRKEVREFIFKWIKNGGKLENIFNLDETALFFKLQRSETLASSAVQGKKVNKDRLTIAIICNALGNKKIRPLVIGKHKKPHCFGRWNPSSIVDYFYNSTAWMTMDIFESWLLDFNRQMKMQNKKVLLLVDNAGGHNITPELIKKLTYVEVFFLPPNTTSIIQPCDQGIIRSFKAFYRFLLTKFCVRMIEEKEELIMPNVKQAIFLIKEAWDKVSEDTISNCWKHAGKNKKKLLYIFND